DLELLCALVQLVLRLALVVHATIAGLLRALARGRRGVRASGGLGVRGALAVLLDPLVAGLLVGLLHRCVGRAARAFRVARVGLVGGLERRLVDLLRVRRRALQGVRQVDLLASGHGGLLRMRRDDRTSARFTER